MARWRFIEFLRSAGVLGYGSALFGFALYGVSVWEHRRGGNVSAEVFVACGVGCVAYGSYRAWLAERKQSEKLLSLLDTQQPKLNLTALGAVNRYDELLDQHIFIVSLLLGNTGAATSVAGWTATYEVNDSVEQMRTSNIRDPYTIPLRDDIKAFTQGEMMPAILANRLIERRASIAGRMLWMVPGNRTAQTTTCAYRIRITCSDYEQNRAEVIYSPSAESLHAHHYFSHEAPPTKRETLVPPSSEPESSIS